MFNQTREYKAVKMLYGDRTTERSKVPLMNHIDEGIEILLEHFAPDVAVLGYIIHPIVQGNLSEPDVSWSEAYELAKEYRDKANSYLCRPETDHIKTVTQLAEIVNPISTNCLLMLYADKKQNQADFLKYHQNHARFNELKAYFELWIDYIESELGLA